MIFLCYLCVSTLLQTKDDFRFIIPYMEFSKEVKGARPLVLDTSVVIDGRIADVAETKVIDQPLVVPRFVLQELQGIADSSDKLKRNRGRRGLDMLKRLQNNPKVELAVHEANLPELREVLNLACSERWTLPPTYKNTCRRIDWGCRERHGVGMERRGYPLLAGIEGCRPLERHPRERCPADTWTVHTGVGNYIR